MTIRIEPDKTIPFPDNLDSEEPTTLRENMQLAANTAAFIKGLGAVVEETPETQDEAGEVFQEFSEKPNNSLKMLCQTSPNEADHVYTQRKSSILYLQNYRPCPSLNVLG